MPFSTVRFPLDTLTPDPGREVVPRGNVINGVSLTDVPVGAAIRFKFGNNQPSSLIRTPGAWEFDGAEITDVSEGLSIVNEAVLPGSFVEMTISYSRSGPAVAGAVL